MTRALAIAQGGYYLLTGIWPLMSMESFERVTGPKIDRWLVKTVGLLAAVMGGVLVVRAVDARGGPDPLLGTAAALTFAAVDTRYAVPGRISRIYLADAAVELGLAAGWIAAIGSRPAREGTG